MCFRLRCPVIMKLKTGLINGDKTMPILDNIYWLTRSEENKIQKPVRQICSQRSDSVLQNYTQQYQVSSLTSSSATLALVSLQPVILKMHLIRNSIVWSCYLNKIKSCPSEQLEDSSESFNILKKKCINCDVRTTKHNQGDVTVIL